MITKGKKRSGIKKKRSEREVGCWSLCDMGVCAFRNEMLLFCVCAIVLCGTSRRTSTYLQYLSCPSAVNSSGNNPDPSLFLTCADCAV